MLRAIVASFWAILPHRHTKPQRAKTYKRLSRFKQTLCKNDEDTVYQLLVDLDVDIRTSSLAYRWRRLELAKSLYTEWEAVEIAARHIYHQNGNAFPLALKDRWAIDVLNETALLVIRLLAEADAYTKAYEVARKTLIILESWQENWRAQWEDAQEKFTFSPYVFRWQMATLYAWKALALYRMKYDLENAARCHALSVDGFHRNDEIRIDDMLTCINKAYQFTERHPLILYVRALVYHRQGVNKSAIRDLQDLLIMISPYEPFIYLANRSLKRVQQKSVFRPRSDVGDHSYRKFGMVQ